MLAGFVPRIDTVRDPAQLYLAVGILGATVMPHNLYLHSHLVQSRRTDTSSAGLRSAIAGASLDSTLALMIAMLVNAALLILAAGSFHDTGLTQIADLSQAYHLISPALGVSAASTVFGIGLIAAGLSSSITGTLAGQVVMEGFVRLRLSGRNRALLTRSLAILPAVTVCLLSGDAAVGRLLVLSQVILGLQLPFAVLPLLWFTTRKRYLGEFAFGRTAAVGLWCAAALVTLVNAWALLRMFQ